MGPVLLLGLGAAASVCTWTAVVVAWSAIPSPALGFVDGFVVLAAILPGAAVTAVVAVAGIRGLSQKRHRTDPGAAAALWWLIAWGGALAIVLVAPEDFRPDGVSRLELAAWTVGQFSLAAFLPVWFFGSAPYLATVLIAWKGPTWSGRGPWLLAPTAVFSAVVIALGGVLLVAVAMIA